MSEEFYVGFDIGSSTVKYAILDKDRNIVHSAEPVMHFAEPMKALEECWESIDDIVDKDKIASTSFTGESAKLLAEVLGLLFEEDSVTVPNGVRRIAPGADYDFHMGAVKPYFFEIEQRNRQTIVSKWSPGTKCGGGSGILVDKQCRRLFAGEVESAGGKQKHHEAVLALAEKKAESSKNPATSKNRCGVTAQTDMIHNQNDGISKEDNIAGLFANVPRNYHEDTVGTTGIDKSRNAVGTGGLFSSSLIKRNLEKIIGMEITVPEHHQNVAAIGIALKAIEENDRRIIDISRIEEVSEKARRMRKFAPSLAEYLKDVEKSPDNEIDFDWTKYEGMTVPVVLGIDGGSTTTKIAAAHLETGELMDKLYIKTGGDAVGAVQEVLRHAGRHRDRIAVEGVASTGSARDLYDRMLVDRKSHPDTLDCVPNEITCHAVGAKYNNKSIDTIFEIGGQDMKFTRFVRASDEIAFSKRLNEVEEVKMNTSCQAGAGQTMENMAEMLGVDVVELNRLALKAKRVPIIDHTCGVFMEIEVTRLIAEGHTKAEISAAIVRATAASYFYKFVGGEKLGDNISAQGGPPLGDGFLAALAQVSGKRIQAFRHREMFGAYGAALKAREEILKARKKGRVPETGFRGWEVIDAKFKREKYTCSELSNERGTGKCKERDCNLESIFIDDEEVISGGGCDRWNTAKRKTRRTTNYVTEYHKIYDMAARKHGVILEELLKMPDSEKPAETVGIKRSTTGVSSSGIWAAAFFRRLGLTPVVSPQSNDEIAEIGVRNAHTEYCIAMKLELGHAAVLNPHVDFVYNPSFIDEIDEGEKLKYCVYVESEGFVAEEALKRAGLTKERSINPVIHFNDRARPVDKAMHDALQRAFGSRFSLKDIRAAMQHADSAEKEFNALIAHIGDAFLSEIEAKGEKAYVGIARDYVNLDRKASSETSSLASELGYRFIPLAFIRHRFDSMDISGIAENMFWKRGKQLIQGAMFVANHNLLYPVYQTNFGCGTDTMIEYAIRDIMLKAKKPLCLLQTDAHENNAPFKTRWEAVQDVVKEHEAGKVPPEVFKLNPVVFHDDKKDLEQRVWVFPFMGPASYTGVSALKPFGIEGIVAPTNTPEAQEFARKHVTTEACMPTKGVVGDIIAQLYKMHESGMDVNKDAAVLLPSAQGPCRFGQYRVILRKFLDKEGFDNVPIISPMSVNDYADIPIEHSLIQKLTKVYYSGIYSFDVLYDALLRTRPYEKEQGAAQEAFDRSFGNLLKAIETGSVRNIAKTMGQNAAIFNNLEMKDGERKPMVLYAGEIYMRWHDPFTQNSVEVLEENGLEVLRQPVTEWVNYINRSHIARHFKQALTIPSPIKEWKKLFEVMKKRVWISYIEGKIRSPFEVLLAGREFHNPMDFISAIEGAEIYHRDIEGESPLSIGTAYELMHHFDNIAGYFHVGPFLCMQETTATAMMNAMKNNYNGERLVPVLHASFGDSPNLNLAAEIAVFREQCYARHEQMKEKREARKEAMPANTVSALIGLPDCYF